MYRCRPAAPARRRRRRVREAAWARHGLPRLVATDLDGTLVRSDETVSDYSHAVLRKVREAGITVVGVTGRGHRLIELCRRDLPEADFFVLAQGGVRAGPARPRRARGCCAARGSPAPTWPRRCAAWRPRSGRCPSWSRRSTARATPLWGDADVVWPYPEWIPYDRVEALAGPAYKGFAHAEHLTADALLADRPSGGPGRPGHGHPGRAGVRRDHRARRGQGQRAGRASPPSSASTRPTRCVFGDMPNDVPMFRWAGWRRVAVANAHPELLAARRRGHRAATTPTAWPPGWRPCLLTSPDRRSAEDPRTSGSDRQTASTLRSEVPWPVRPRLARSTRAAIGRVLAGRPDSPAAGHGRTGDPAGPAGSSAAGRSASAPAAAGRPSAGRRARPGCRGRGPRASRPAGPGRSAARRRWA